uniref:Uncharacterized protein n=1 Tax=Oryza brachyantha TaxID=4533 RepID=J3M8D8_ORYBR
HPAPRVVEHVEARRELLLRHAAPHHLARRDGQERREVDSPRASSASATPASARNRRASASSTFWPSERSTVTSSPVAMRPAEEEINQTSIGGQLAGGGKVRSWWRLSYRPRRRRTGRRFLCTRRPVLGLAWPPWMR